MTGKHCIILQAEPKPLEIDLKRAAIVVVDMQNAFASKGGMIDLWGFDISSISEVVKVIKKILSTARKKNIKIIYIAHRISPDLREVGLLSPFFSHDKAIEAYYKKPGMRDTMILRGSWGAEIIDELKPQDTEILIEKRRFSAFIGTDLDMILRTFDIRHLIFVGVATNICVESTLRDAFHKEYFPILVSDATAAFPASRHQATIDNVKQVFGWVTTSQNIIKAMT
jgi:ureidoacrylate peracid hydrolase